MGVFFIDEFAFAHEVKEIPTVNLTETLSDYESNTKLPSLRNSHEITIDLDVRNKDMDAFIRKLITPEYYGREPYSMKCKKCFHMNDCIKRKINDRWNGRRY